MSRRPGGSAPAGDRGGETALVPLTRVRELMLKQELRLAEADRRNQDHQLDSDILVYDDRLC